MNKPKMFFYFGVILCASFTKSISGEASPIIGGTPTSIEEFPFLAGVMGYDILTQSYKLVAGAVVISKRIALTVAHQENYEKWLQVQSSVRDVINELFRVEKYIPHERYMFSNKDCDIAMLVTEINMSLEENHFANIHFNEDLIGNEPVKAAGWGVINYRPDKNYTAADYRRTLRSVNLQVYNRDNCSELYKKRDPKTNKPLRTAFPAITDNMICAGWPAGGRDACQGDSGSCLVYKKQDLTYVVGLVSFGKGCGNATYPGVYTRINKFLGWICDESRKLNLPLASCLV